MTSPGSGFGAHVLLVDDNHLVRRALARMLRRGGHEVSEAESAEQALECLHRQPEIDVVLTDIRMPDVDGTELLERVRERFGDLPVILMTGAPGLETAVKAVHLGALEYLTKPVDGAQLENALIRALRRRSGLTESSPQSGEAHMAAAGAAARGRVLAGRYRIVDLIGAGGMGAVYEACTRGRHPIQVAVKVLHPMFCGRRDLIERFRREAEIVASLAHPNIVQVFDFHSSLHGETFLVMELLRGQTLAETIAKEGRLGVPRALGLARQVLSALTAAHSAGVIHRDLKPENVFLQAERDGTERVKVVDFGIAKLLGATGEQQLTETGTVLGTPAYMAPECARGEHIDQRADVYALGCCLYEALSGKPPFSAENYNALLFAIQEREPLALETLRPDIPIELATILRKAMARDMNARFESAIALEEALLPWLPDAPPPSHDPWDTLTAGSAPTVHARLYPPKS